MSNTPYTPNSQNTKPKFELTNDLPKILQTPPHSPLISIKKPSDQEIDSILDHAWEAVARNLPPYSTPDPDTLDKLSATIYKLKSCSNNAKATSLKEEELQIKKQEFLIKQEDYNSKNAERLAAINKSQRNAKGLSEEELRFIEQKLNLL